MPQKYQRRPTDVETIKVCEENLAELRELAKMHNFEVTVFTRVSLTFIDDDIDDDDGDKRRAIYDGDYLILQSNKELQSCTPSTLAHDYVLIPAMTTAKYGIAPYEFPFATRHEAISALSKQSQDSCWLGFYDNNAFESNKDHGYIHFVGISYLHLNTKRKEYYARNIMGGWDEITDWLKNHPDQVEPALTFP